MSALERIYVAGLSIARPILTATAPLLPDKVQRGVRGRRSTLATFEAWQRPARGRLVWFHAPSLGESLMARAIVHELRLRDPDIRIAFTYFSPSAEQFVEREIAPDVHAYVPWDTPSDVRRALEALRPSCIAFVRTEVWPTLVKHAVTNHVATALVNAILPVASSRTNVLARSVLGPAYRRLDAIGAVSEIDAQRYRNVFSVTNERAHVTGDARFDQVHSRTQSPRVDSAVIKRLRFGSTCVIVAGSTWPADEEHLLPAFAALGSDTRLIIAPHDPTASHIQSLAERLRSLSLEPVTLSEFEAGAIPPRAIIVDRVGILADLYRAGDAAFVGGGFHDAGLHSVVEPAGFGIPVLFGPRHSNAAEAAALAEAGGGIVVDSTSDLGVRLSRLCADPEERAHKGSSALNFFRARLGGGARNADLILRLMNNG